MKNFRKIAAVVALGAIAAGCQAPAPRMAAPSPIPAPIQSSPVDGEWMATDGVAISRFSGGSFETLATDTGNRLAEGTYRFRDQRTIEINLRSLIRQTMSSVNCSLVTPGQLNCTSSTGQQFVLVRRGIA